MWLLLRGYAVLHCEGVEDRCCRKDVLANLELMLDPLLLPRSNPGFYNATTVP